MSAILQRRLWFVNHRLICPKAWRKQAAIPTRVRLGALRLYRTPVLQPAPCTLEP